MNQEIPDATRRAIRRALF